MHREPLLSLIRDYRLSYSSEAEVIDRLESFIERHPDCFNRELALGHITGSTWLVNRSGTAVLLTHHRKLNRWLQLGGHAEGCADIHSVAMREAYEESGLKEIRAKSQAIFDIDIHRIPERGSEKAHDHYDIRFALEAVGSDEYIVSDESHALSWVPIGDLGLVTDDQSLIRMKEKWLTRPQ